MHIQSLTGTFHTTAEGLAAAVSLNHGRPLPWLGLGVWQINGDSETERVVRAAIDCGYRSIDTAKIYGNERGVGRAIRECGVPREQLFVTTKVWNDDNRAAIDCGYRSIDTAKIYGNERGVGRAIRACGVPREQLFVTTKVWNDDNRAGRIEAAFDQSMKLLGLDYVDLYLVHWAMPGRVVPTWKAMEKLLHTGRVKAIGVSNHLRPHLDELLAAADVVPAVNQIEFHPYLQSKPLVEFCHARGIRPEAWSPLMVGGPVLQDPALIPIARRHGKTVAQVILRWEVQSGVVTIPKTTRPERMQENANIFDFELSPAEMAAVAALDRSERTGADPLNVPF